MEWFEAIILGLVQGLTEFLPVSSSGHLTIGAHLFGIDAESNLSFNIAVHTATVLSTLFVLRKEFVNLLKGFFKFTLNEETKYILKIGISMIPIMIIGLFFKDSVESVFASGILIVGICLIVTSLLLFFAHFAKVRQKEKISWLDAAIIGLSQAVAILPGLSRSGTTIATGILLGNKKEEVAKFSFFMVIIPILGEAFLDLIKIDTISSNSLPISSLALGFITAFITGCFACKVMLNIVKKGKLLWFAIYCLLVGSMTLIFL